MIPIPVVWTNYTTVARGRVLKLVPCENCSTEYVYVLEREGEGVGTSVYFLNDEQAEKHSGSAARDTLQQYLANDFDPVPCPVCGHYQRYMFPKLYESTSGWRLLATLVLLTVGSLSAVGVLYWVNAAIQQPTAHNFVRLGATVLLLAVAALAGLGLSASERARFRRFDPNFEYQPFRIEKGRRRAVTRAEFEAMQQPPPGAMADRTEC